MARDEEQSPCPKMKDSSIRHLGVKPEHCDFWTRGSQIPGLSDEQYQQFLNMFGEENTPNSIENQPIANIAGKLESDSKWVMDSGATVHITHKTDWFDDDVRASNELPVVIPNGASIPVEGRGTCTLPNGMRIKDVLYVPKFTCNLLSVNRLSKDLNCAVSFFPTFCVMQDLRSKRLIGVGKCKDGLYEMDMVGNRRKAMVITLDTWHKRLGHASHDKLSKFDFVKNSSTKTDSLVCDSCARAKHTRLPFPMSCIKTKDCFELVHCDIWEGIGPHHLHKQATS